MKTNDIIHSLECCPKDLCGECSFEEHMNCTNVLARAAADHLVELRNQVSSCNKRIEDMKKTIHNQQEKINKLKKELAEREAAPG